MAIITLTTDLGTRDHYLSVVKGVIYTQLPEATIVDVSHHIPPFDIAAAAFVIKGSFPSFPKGSIHVIGIDTEWTDDKPPVIVAYAGHYFVGADNGIFSLMFDRIPDDVFEITLEIEQGDHTFPLKDLFTKVACHLARGGTPEIVGKRRDRLNQKQMYRPIVEENIIRGAVIYIDSYGNVITNVTKSLFQQVGRGRDFILQFRSSAYSISIISKRYNDVPEGEKLALFGSSGYLEIAINKGVEGSGGGANKLFGIQLYDMINIEFQAI